MRRVPQGNLEFALMADGVPRDQVYPALSTPEGLERAFRKLDTIKDEVIWWEAGAQPQQMLADGEVVMSTAYNGSVFNARVLEDQPFVIVRDGQLLARPALRLVVLGRPPGRTERTLQHLAGAIGGVCPVASRVYGTPMVQLSMDSSTASRAAASIAQGMAESR